MCGFVGFLDEAINYSAETVIRNMADKIVHRGPDSDGYFCENKVGMGFRRLSIIDLDGGHQPIYNEDKNLVVTYNGEIYNYLELREELIAKGGIYADLYHTQNNVRENR